MFEKLTHDDMMVLEFHTRKLGEVNIESLLVQVSAGCEKLKNGEPMIGAEFLEFFRGFATIRDIAKEAVHTDYLKKRGVSRDQLAKCQEIVGNFKQMEGNVKEYFNQFVVGIPLHNKPHR